jgi:hypothetical protein
MASSKPNKARSDALVVRKRVAALAADTQAGAIVLPESEQSRRLLFLTDEDVPDQVGRFLRSHGHEVRLSRSAEVF